MYVNSQEIMKDIIFLELIPIIIAIEVWRIKLYKKKILFYVDNLSLVSVIRKQSSKSKRLVQLIRHFSFIKVID